MIVCTLTWKEPTEGSHTILFPDADEADLVAVDEWVRKGEFASEVGDTIAAMHLSKKKGRAKDDDP